VGRRRRRRTGRCEPNRRCDVIARFWSAETTRAQAPAYRHQLTTPFLLTLRKADGNPAGLVSVALAAASIAAAQLVPSEIVLCDHVASARSSRRTLDG
jgi:hypothetical protein